MITLTPSGDILLEGLGKVGEWEENHPYIYACVKMEMIRMYHYQALSEQGIISMITKSITNGFTPKKWEE